MPKLKTRKSLSKRVVKITASGRLLRRKTLSQHLAHRKSRRTRKNSGNKVGFATSQGKKARILINR